MAYRRVLFFLIVVFTLFAGSIIAQAQDPDTKFDRINDVASNLNCPTCTGINLSDCRTLTCEQWRDKISDLIDEGYSEQEILDYFATRYGVQVLQEPPRTGFTMWLWFLPLAALAAGGGWLAYTMRGWAETGDEEAEVDFESTESSSSAGGSDSDNYLNQVEKDLDLV